MAKFPIITIDKVKNFPREVVVMQYEQPELWEVEDWIVAAVLAALLFFGGLILSMRVLP